MGGVAEAYIWTVSGTLYADRAGSAVLPGGEIILQDRAGNVISLTANSAGNFWTTAPIASNPYTVVSHSGITDILYILDADGNLVHAGRPHRSPDLDLQGLGAEWLCRPAHADAGAGGRHYGHAYVLQHAPQPDGLPGRPVGFPDPMRPSYPASGLSYGKDIYPILNGKCVPCHVSGSTMTRLVTKSDIDIPSTSFDYSHGLDLQNYAGFSVSGNVKLGVRSVVDTAHPAESLILNKTLPGAVHAGGAFWDQTSPDYPGPQTVDHGRGPEEFRLQPASHFYTFIG